MNECHLHFAISLQQGYGVLDVASHFFAIDPIGHQEDLLLLYFQKFEVNCLQKANAFVIPFLWLVNSTQVFTIREVLDPINLAKWQTVVVSDRWALDHATAKESHDDVEFFTLSLLQEFQFDDCRIIQPFKIFVVKLDQLCLKPLVFLNENLLKALDKLDFLIKLWVLIMTVITETLIRLIDVSLVPNVLLLLRNGLGKLVELHVMSEVLLYDVDGQVPLHLVPVVLLEVLYEDFKGRLLMEVEDVVAVVLVVNVDYYSEFLGR